MKLVKSLLTKNPCYTAGKKITVKGLMLHSVGCPQPRASVFINSWNRADYDNACVHAFIDGNDGTVYQTLPWNHRGWHCASGKNGSGNNTHIGVEMCEPACIKYTGGSTFICSDMAIAKAVAKRTYEAAAELFAMLCKEYDLNPTADGVIISHAEGHKRGIASNHGDPEHLWRQLGMGYAMDGFRKDVKAAMTEKVSGMQATEFISLSETEVVAKVGALFTADQKKSGILASVSLAQFILESGYGKSELAQNANNCFGMKKSLSGNTWSGSGWGFIRNYPYHSTLTYISFAAKSALLHLPYIVRFTIFNLLFVPSTKPFESSLATEFSTASISFSNPFANRDISFNSEFLYRSIIKYNRGILFFSYISRNSRTQCINSLSLGYFCKIYALRFSLSSIPIQR